MIKFTAQMRSTSGQLLAISTRCPKENKQKWNFTLTTIRKKEKIAH